MLTDNKNCGMEDNVVIDSACSHGSPEAFE